MAVLLATVLTRAFWPWLNQHAFAMFFAAVTVTAWRCGFGPSLVTIILSLPVLNYFFQSPAGNDTPGFNFDVISLLRLGVFATVSSLIAAFALQRQRAEVALATAGARNAAVLQNIPGVVWEARGQPDHAGQQINFVSDYVYSVDEWLSRPNFWLSIVHPDDRERAARESAAIFAAGKKGVSGYAQKH